MNPRLTLILAVVQTRLRLLASYEDEFREPSDQRVLEDLRADLTEYIGRKASEGESPSNPAEFISDVLTAIDGVLVRTEECLASCRRFGADVLHPTRKTLSREILARYPSDLHEFSERMRQTLDEIANSFPLEEWCADYDIFPDLVFVAEHIRPELRLRKRPHRDLVEFLNLTGKAYAEVGKHFSTVAEKSGKLLQSHMQQAAELETARSMLQSGNFLLARKQIERLSPYFTDIDGDPLLKECDEVARRLEEPRERFKYLKEEAMRPTGSRAGDGFNPWGIRARAAAHLAPVTAFRQEIGEFQRRSTELAGSDYAREATDLVSTLQKQSSHLETEITTAYKALEKKAWGNLTKAGVGAAVVAALVVGGLKLQEIRRLDHEAWEAARQSATAKGDAYEKAIEEYKQYAEAHPRGRHHAEAVEMIEKTLPQKVRERDKRIEDESNTNDREAWETAVAAAKAAETNFEKAADAYQAYLKTHPKGGHATEAATLLKALPQKIVDRDWQAIAESARTAAPEETWNRCDEFIQKNHESSWVADATKLRDAAGVKVYAEISRKGHAAVAARDWNTAYGHFTRALKFHARDPDSLALILKYKPYEQPAATALVTLPATHGPVTALACAPDARWVLTGHANGAVTLWDAAEGKETRQLRGHTGAVNAVAFGPDPRFVATGGDDQSIRLWDLATGTQTRALKASPGKVVSLAFSPDGATVVASRARDPQLRLYEVATGNEIRALQGHTESASGLAFSPDGKTLYSSGNDCTLRVWDVAKGRSLRSLTGHLKPITGFSVSEDGRQMFTGSKDGTLRLWNSAGGKEALILQSHPEYATSVAFSPNAHLALAANSDGTLSLYDLAAKKEARLLPAHAESASSVVWTVDPGLAYSAGRDGLIKLWNMWDADKPAAPK